MTPKNDKPEEMCIPKDEACDYLKLGLDTAKWLEDELDKLHQAGISTPELDDRVKKMRRKLKAAEKKWEL